MVSEQQFKDAMKRLMESHNASLEKHGAIDMVAGNNFVGFVGVDDKGAFCWVKSWGCDKGKLYGESIEAVTDRAFAIYDGEGAC